MKEVLDQKYVKSIYLNILKAIIIMLYFFVIVQTYENINIKGFETTIEIISMVFLAISIFVFEKSYKKDDEKMAIHGIETLLLAIYTITTSYITRKFELPVKNYSYAASYIFAIYYVFGSILIYTKAKKETLTNMSDIREIVKKTEPIKKEATKQSVKEQRKLEQLKIKQAIEEGKKNENLKKNQPKKQTKSTRVTKSKKPTKSTTKSAKKPKTNPEKSKTKKEIVNKKEKEVIKK